MSNIKTAVCVIGGGIAGLAACIAAKQNGASVVLLDDQTMLCNPISVEAGPLAVGTRLARQKMVGLTVELAFRQYMHYTHWQVDAMLVRDYLEKSADTILWLENMGVGTLDVCKSFPSSEPTVHIIDTPVGKSASVFLAEKLLAQAERLGCKIIGCTNIKMQPNNAGTRKVRCQDLSGNQLCITCTGTIIASEGSHSGRDLAWNVGGGKTPVIKANLLSVSAFAEKSMVQTLFRQPSVLCVDANGKRFLSEELLEDATHSGNAVRQNLESTAYAIVDSSLLKHYCENGLDSIFTVQQQSDRKTYADLIAEIRKGNSNYIFEENSLERLANQMGLDYTQLSKTLDHYNDGCDSGVDLFYKNKRYLKPLIGPTFFAARLAALCSSETGGIAIDSATHVITDKGKPVLGLFAAGADACNILGDSYISFLPGNILGFALNSGRIAGENASDYAAEQ